MNKNNNIREIINECVDALELEINELKTMDTRVNSVHDGFFIGKEEDLYLYLFRLDEEIYLMDEAPIRIKIKNLEIAGITIYCETFEILLALEEFIGVEIKSAKLYSNPWELLVELQQRLKEIEENINRNKTLTRKLVEVVPLLGLLGNHVSKENVGQAAAINKAMKDEIVFIWGPPGTGKTFTLANIALKSFIRGGRVLILSHSNIAVDGAIEAIWKLISNELLEELEKDYEVFPIIRYGYSRTDFIKNSPYLNSYNQALNMDYETKCEIEELETAIEDLFMEIRASKFDIADKQLEIIHLKKVLSMLKKIIRDIEKKYIVPKAKIIATTISKAQIDSTIFKDMYDIVLLDEASMAYIPQSIYAASLAKEKIVFIGDFRQLPPIATSEGELVDKWLKRDIFEFSKVKDCVNDGKFHPNMIMLNEQRRMHPSISKFVNENIYGNLLKDHISLINDKTSKETLSIIDTSGMPSICRVDENGSRFNILNAFISVITAIKHYNEGYDSIGIITPYNAQSKLINNILNDIFIDKSERNISCATVHKFQGSEKDIIIFDTVDSYRLRRPGVLLTDDRNDKSERLINVAVTRARKKFILISNMQYWNSRWSSGKILYQLFDYLKDNGEIYDYKHIYDASEYIDADIKNLWFCSPDSDIENLHAFTKKFSSNIANCNSIYVSIPNSLKGSVNLIETPVIKAIENNSKVIIQTEDMDIIPENLRNVTTVEDFIWLPIVIINEEILYYGYPFIFNDYVKDNILMKFKGIKTVRNLIVKLNIKFKESSLQTSFRDFIEEYLRCNDCGHPLTVKKSRRNKYFIGCTNYPNCNYTESISFNMVNFYLEKYNIDKCDECGGKMGARIGRYGLFIGCFKYPECKNTRDLDRYIE